MPLQVDLLRPLTLHAAEHPHGRPHVSAARGLVCAHGKVYVVGDDEHHLAIYTDASSTGQLHPLLPGRLPRNAAARKRHKADLECLLLAPANPQRANSQRLDDQRTHTPPAFNQLLALGSCATPQRERAVCLPLGADGWPTGAPAQTLSLTATSQWLRQRLGPLNLEGAFRLGPWLVLLNRGHPTGAGNLALRYRWADALRWLRGQAEGMVPADIQALQLGHLNGVPLGFTDGVACPLGGGWLYTAVAEHSADSVADGPCLGAVLGQVDGRGQLSWQRSLPPGHKVEGLDVQVQQGHAVAFMVTDADDPDTPAWLLSARL